MLVGESGRSEPVPLDKVLTGDLIEVLPGGRIPLDGTVAEGVADVDESMLTGESAPVTKSPGSEVFAGTCPVTGRLEIMVTGDAGKTLLSKIIRTVEEAQARKAPIQGVADRISGWFVPAVLLLALATFTWWILSGALPVRALMNAVSVLVIACPCALGLATPLAILTGTSAVGRKGILVKGGDIFESVSKTTTVVLDKTGTITRGEPTVVDAVDYGVSGRFTQCCSSLENWSEHPAGRAIASSWKGERLPVEQFRAIPGMGVSGVVAGEEWLAGSPALLELNGVTIDESCRRQAGLFEASGKTTVFVSCEGRVAGLFGLIDDLRDDVPVMIASLRKQGLRLMILTGDNEGVARYIASKCGIDEVLAGLSPIGKAETVRRLRSEGETVLMVGDGINDAPALMEADTGVTFGTATAIAIESAGVTILSDDLRLLGTLFVHSRRCFSVIRQNLAWAFGYNMVAVPLAVSGMLHPIVSALLMATSSLVVVANSLRLKNI
jgi:Cu2+-exporting ATPase